jgi:diguanylate cyclase (GGDEF)-like protein
MIFDSTVVFAGAAAPDHPSGPGLPAELAPSVSEFLLAGLARDNDAFTVKDCATGQYLVACDALAGLLSCPPMVGKTDAELLDADAAKLLLSADQTAQSHNGVLQSEHKFERDGARKEFNVMRQCLALPDGRRYLLALWRDATVSRRKEAQLRTALDQLEQQQLANAQLRREVGDQLLRDRSSGLATRAHFEDQLDREIDLSTREHREFALVLIDIDAVTPASAAQDAAVKERVYEALGRLLRSNTRVMDASCRYDDDRFAVLLSGVGLATAHARVEGLRRQCATQIVAHAGQDMGFTVSMGVASFPHTALTKDDLQLACITALGEAHKRGGNRVALASIQFQAGPTAAL